MKTKLIPFFALLAALTLVSCSQGTGTSSSSDSSGSPVITDVPATGTTPPGTTPPGTTPPGTTASDLDLASLTVTVGTLVPSFSAKTFDYTVIVPAATTSITVTAVPVSMYAGLGLSPGKNVDLTTLPATELITVSEPITAGVDIKTLKTQRYTITFTKSIKK